MSARAATLPRTGAITAAVIALGCLAIAVRPNTYASTAILLAVGVAGAITPLASRSERARPLVWLAVAVVGIAIFAGGRMLGSPIGVRYTALGIAMIVIAAVCEEAFFRRLVYGFAFERAGVVAAFVVSSVLFALIHVPAYGWPVFPIDLAAGAVLAWQRWASGSWTAPALTHIVANLLQMG